jgi:hypothetical protein
MDQHIMTTNHRSICSTNGGTVAQALIKPAWHMAPDWAQWWAVDSYIDPSEAVCNWFMNEPSLGKRGMWVDWDSEPGTGSESDPDTAIPEGYVWDRGTSLHSRPDALSSAQPAAHIEPAWHTAPAWASWWAVDKPERFSMARAFWFRTVPELDQDGTWLATDEAVCRDLGAQIPVDYDWQNSLQCRPQPAAPESRTPEELASLKADWNADPCWDIEDTEGYGAHREELKAFRLQHESAQADQRRARVSRHLQDPLQKAAEALEDGDLLGASIYAQIAQAQAAQRQAEVLETLLDASTADCGATGSGTWWE